tara:strand:+ start:1526 stop:1930 length:405 start_codon:yes stop_codon:yes gene_type:complete
MSQYDKKKPFTKEMLNDPEFMHGFREKVKAEIQRVQSGTSKTHPDYDARDYYPEKYVPREGMRPLPTRPLDKSKGQGVPAGPNIPQEGYSSDAAVALIERMLQEEGFRPSPSKGATEIKSGSQASGGGGYKQGE